MEYKDLKVLIDSGSNHKDQGHWISNNPIIPVGLHGFVYAIHNVLDDKYYVGKKNFLHGGKKNYKRKGVKVPNYKYGTETNWKTYTGSSAELNLDIARNGIDNFLFLVLRLYQTRGGLSYGEANLQHKLDVLTMKDDNNKAKFYNGNIAGIKFIPKETGKPT